MRLENEEQSTRYITDPIIHNDNVQGIEQIILLKLELASMPKQVVNNKRKTVSFNIPVGLATKKREHENV